MSEEANSQATEGVFLSRAAVSGVPWMVLSKAVLFLVYMGLSISTVRFLGKEKYGLYSLSMNLVEYLAVLCALGLNSALLRFIPELTVRRNRAGLRRLLWKVLGLQQAAVVAMGFALWFARPWLDRWFHADFQSLPLFIAVLISAVLFKDFLNDTNTGFFRSRRVAVLSMANGAVWLGLLWLLLSRGAEVHRVFLAQILSLVLLYAVGAALLVRDFRRMDWRSPPYGIGKRRTLKLSIPTMMNTMLRMLMLKYTEVFFLGVYWGTAVVGVYDLGYSTPFMALTLVPSALQTLFTSGFAEAYARDPKCLGRLIDSVYKMLILTVVPLAAFGFFFAPRAVVLFYGAAMKDAGTVAAAFSLLHVLPLISMPLSMAITTKEKVLNMLPYMLLQVVMNLGLDWLLIPRFGIPGAVGAVLATFVLTIPLRLRAVRQIVGGIYFPTRFLLRTLGVAALLSGALSFLAPHVNVAGLFALGLAYLGVFAVSIRVVKLLSPADVRDLRSLGLGKINRVLDLLVGRGHQAS